MQSLPRITVAICTYNRAGYLADTLGDLASQQTDPELFEILVINNNSRDGTETVCEIFSKTNPKCNFCMVTEKKQGLSFARNRAAKEAAAEAIFYIDDDVKLPENFVETALNYLDKRPSTLCAGGRIFVDFDEPEEEPDWIPGELMPMFGLHDLGDDDLTYPRGNFPRGGNMMIQKTVFEAFGYFDTTLGRTGDQLLGSEEKDFFEKIRRNGVDLHYWSDLKLTHRIGADRLDREYLAKQSEGIGRSERLRLKGDYEGLLKKIGSELFKLTGSLFLSILYLMQSRAKAAGFLLQFRLWVLKGFLSGPSGK